MIPQMPSPAGEGGAGRDLLGGWSRFTPNPAAFAAQCPILARHWFRDGERDLCAPDRDGEAEQ